MFVDLKCSPPPEDDGVIAIQVSQVAFRKGFVLRIALPIPILKALFGDKIPDLPRLHVQFGFGSHRGKVLVSPATDGEGYSLVYGGRRVPLLQISRRPDYIRGAAFPPTPTTDMEIGDGKLIFTLPATALEEC
jgi:hypothetical protein